MPSATSPVHFDLFDVFFLRGVLNAIPYATCLNFFFIGVFFISKESFMQSSV
jgi:hypothetical protein